METKPITITLSPGQAVRIELSEGDGAFEIHYDTPKHTNKLVVEEVENLEDTSGRTGILYCEDFSPAPGFRGTFCAPEEEEQDSTEFDKCVADSADTGAPITDGITYAIYWGSQKGWYRVGTKATTVETRDVSCEIYGVGDALRVVRRLHRDYGTAAMLTVVRSDEIVVHDASGIHLQSRVL